MSGLLLPGNVAREIMKDKWVEQRAHQRALIDRMLDFDTPLCREWRPVLAGLDPLLRLGKARPQAYEPGISIIPGYYHWVRDNPGAPATVTPITGPDGKSFAEPSSRLLEDLKSNDLQDPRVYGRLLAQHAVEEAQEEKEKLEFRERRQDEIRDRINAAMRTSVSMNDSTPWTQNQSPASRRDARRRMRKDTGK